MKIIVCENYNEMSEKAACLIAEQITSKPTSVLGLATGSTPMGLYNFLVQMNEKQLVDFREVKSFNLDEYYPIKPDNPQSYHYFMNENLFSKINIKPENIHILDGTTANPSEECSRFEKLIEQSGGIDIQILGIGENGHIGFNEPNENLNPKTHLTQLAESTIKANSRFFDNYDDVPKQALTMGIGSILKAKKIILLASGSNKREIIYKLLKSDINTNLPASLLKLHPNVILIADKNAFPDQL